MVSLSSPGGIYSYGFEKPSAIQQRWGTRFASWKLNQQGWQRMLVKCCGWNHDTHWCCKIYHHHIAEIQVFYMWAIFWCINLLISTMTSIFSTYFWIQPGGIKPILDGRDTIGQAQFGTSSWLVTDPRIHTEKHHDDLDPRSGTGKTATFVWSTQGEGMFFPRSLLGLGEMMRKFASFG